MTRNHETRKDETMTTAMVPTAADYERLGRTLCLARGEDPDGRMGIMGGACANWEAEGIDDDNDCVSEPRESLDDFRRNSQNWREPGQRREVNGGLYWEKCQAVKGQPRCELCIVDCGDFRLIFQC